MSYEDWLDMLSDNDIAEQKIIEAINEQHK